MPPATAVAEPYDAAERGAAAVTDAAAGSAVTNGKASSSSSSFPETLAWHVHRCAAPARGWRAWVGRGEEHAILTDVAGETRAGECTAVLGPSGCGKVCAEEVVVGLDLDLARIVSID